MRAEIEPGGCVSLNKSGAVSCGGGEHVGEADEEKKQNAHDLGCGLTLDGLPRTKRVKRQAGEVIEKKIENLENADESSRPVTGENNLQGRNESAEPEIVNDG